MTKRLFRCLSVVIGGIALFLSSGANAADWPMWRSDAARSAVTREQLPADLSIQWSRRFSPRKQAWDDPLNLDLMTYDRVFEPVVAGDRMFVGFNERDKVVSFDLKTGEELWAFIMGGPVRMPPAVWNDRVYAASDDGHLYCLNAADGALLWKFRGGPSSRQILGNQRMVSAWPMRGGPVVRDGVVYTAASIWPFMGTFIYALDAETGAVKWVNDETGAQYIRQPHSAPSFAGVAPQGALVATENKLIVPGGRSVPAVFDRATGKLNYFEINAGGKGTGGSFVAANDSSWYVHTRLKGTREFALDSGVKTAFQPNEPVLAGNRIYSAELQAGKPVIKAWDNASKAVLWQADCDARGDLILAGKSLFAASAPNDGHSTLTALTLPEGDKVASIEWSTKVPGQVERLVAANGRLVAVTLEGMIHVLGAGRASDAPPIEEQATLLAVEPTRENAIRELFAQGPAEGYAVWVGDSSSPMVHAAAKASPFVELTIFDNNAQRVAESRRVFDKTGLGGRVSVHHSSWEEMLPPPYVANMVFVGPDVAPALASNSELVAKLYETVRPYGGVMTILGEESQLGPVRERIGTLRLANAKVEQSKNGLVVRRVGALPGAGSWTHQYGDIANTIKSADTRVKLPLGVLWFGGVSNEDILPRHGHGPPEQVVGGRLVIQGMNSLTARDVYTGRVLWKRDFENLGTYDVFFDDTYKETPLDPAYNQVHIPGANARGTNYVVTADRVYILEGATCHVLDASSGKTLVDIKLPQENPAQPEAWGYIGIYDDLLIGGVGFAKYRDRLGLPDDPALSAKKAAFGPKSLDRAASMGLVAFDRITGQQLWKVDAQKSFWHNGIVAGGGRIYVLDRHPKPVEEFLQRRGKSEAETYRLAAFDARTGRQVWELPGQVFGTWLGYSEKHDLLLQAGAAASDRLSSEVGQGMAVYDAATGKLAWQKEDLKYAGPCVLHNDLIITNANSYSESAGAFHLVDGTPKLTENPLTGELQPWKITRAYGCNNIIASENLLTFRSGAAGFYDLLTEGGTGNFGGFKSGCTSNLVVADGVLNAPDYTRTCSCAYQNQTSLALVHMPEMDAWTISNSVATTAGQVSEVGLNLSAPGDRRDPNGVMWLAVPGVVETAPDFQIEMEGDVQPFQDHPSTQEQASLPWVASSGVVGLTRLKFLLTPQFAKPAGRSGSSRDADCADGEPVASAPYRVRLHFAAPRNSQTTERRFSVTVQGQPLGEPVQLGGEAKTAVVKTIERISLTDLVEIVLTPEQGTPVLSGIELQRLAE